VASSIPTIIAPGAERIMHAGTWWQVFFSELTPTPGRWKSTLRATVAMIVGIALTALVGESSFVMCAVAAMTESTPGTVHSPSLLFKRFGTSAACGLFSIMLVATFPQAPMLLFVGILAGIWMVLYLVRLLPVGASGLRVAIWTFAPLFSVPLNDPAGFDRMAALSVLGVSSGVAISYVAALLVFPGAESVRARYAVNGLLQESAARLRAIAARGRAGRQGDPGVSQFCVSLEDDLMKVFGGESIRKWVEYLMSDEDLPLESDMLTKSLENAQKKLELYNYDIRKNVFQYDNILNSQRKQLFQARKRILCEINSSNLFLLTVNISSKNSIFAGPNNIAYGATKADQAHQVRLLAAELGAHQIRVNGINPDGVVRGSGIFSSGWGANRAAVYGVEEEKLGEYYAQRSILKREVLPENIAAAVFVLCTSDLSLTTGLHIPVDSGVAAAFMR
jgi:enoyl-[acyl-carrier-protein] reductase (NADH)